VLQETGYRRAYPPLMDRLLGWSWAGLAGVTWISAGLFGLYILAFYAGALYDGEATKWNEILPGLYDPDRAAATAGIGLHFAAGGLILALGGIQLIGAIRTRWPAVHRWIGRVYVTASLLAGLGGITFILTSGTIGGPVMSLGFGLYGVLTVLCAVQAFRHARARRFDVHRAWALRLFALAIGSWLYRMDYGFWLLFTGGAGHTGDFHGPFDQVMAFFFYIPNLLVVEMLLRSTRKGASLAGKISAAAAFVAATGFLLLGTYYFTKFYWGPAIVHRLAG
jgi:hypothetical protein